ncbi:anti-sigma factor family protein [Taibaiella chishuiensis]|uniref:Uncharacterized protein n=1 Tax=Taibaiella chishuiensis TaxID=1434707 RepID=A0A2P8CYT0_9BACT|nr:hypothetical protein [Taibaiella chishuiensis]PSK90128.1 hypothetical protein B0I18_109134 [Taibaiella chishuiensis]
MEINPNNIEEQILLYVDGELSTEEAGNLLQYIALHPQWRILLEEYKSLVLPPEDELVFEGKEALLQPEPQVLPFKPSRKPVLMRRAAAVALIAGAAGLTWLFSRQDIGSALPGSTPVALVHQPVAVDTTTPGAPATVTPTPTVMIARSNTQTMTTAKNGVVQPATALPGAQVARHESTPVDPIAGNLPVAVGEAPPKQRALEMQRPLALTEAESADALASKASLPGWLPVSDQKLEGLNGLIAHIRGVKDSVASKAAQLKRTTFVIRLGEKEIAFRK